MQTDLLFKPATELANLIRGGDISSRELVETSLERIEALEPELNAFAHLDPEGALAAADLVRPGDERPFAGVPIAIKDTAEVAGWPYTLGSDVFGDFVPSYDAFVVRRLREAGFVFVGKTSLPEFGILPVTEPRRFGPTRNPWDTERTPGGSSGGAAAAVASGMLPLAHGSDGGGSIRIPASCCGLVGLKPTRGRVSRGPDQGEDFLVQDGVLSRTVAETAALLDVLAGYETGDASWAPPSTEPFATAARRDPGRLRIGVALGAPIEIELDPQSERAVHDAGKLLESLDYLLARTQLASFGRGIVPLWDDHDVVVTPALARRPVRIGEIDACSDDPWGDFRLSGEFTPYTALFNITEQPAISVPLFKGDDGLPLAVQLAGRPADEATLVSLAAQLEEARPWVDRRPELATA